MIKKHRILVIGASGVLGGLICREINKLSGDSIDLYVGDYNAARGKETAEKLDADFCETDTDDTARLSASLSDKDIVIVAIKQSEPLIQRICLERSVPCIDITVYYSFAQKVERLYESYTNAKSTSLLMAGFFPGLSGLLLQKAIKDLDIIKEANITLLQNTNAKAGTTGIIDMLKIISEPVAANSNEKLLPGFHVKYRTNIPQSDKTYTVRLISHSEKDLLQEKFKIQNLNYWTAWNSPVFNTLVSILIKSGMLNFVIQKMNKKLFQHVVMYDERKPEETFLLAEVKGLHRKKEEKRQLAIKAFSDYGTTAKVAAALTKIVMKKKSMRVCFPFEITTLDELLDIINDERVKFIEY